MRKPLSTQTLATVAVAAFLAITGNAAHADQPLVTRLVMQFNQLETTLLANAQQGDQKAVGDLLADHFEMRTNDTPGEPIPRADWIQQFIQAHPQGSISQMAVHDYDSVDVVSFLYQSQSPAGKPQRIGMVDIWQRINGNWKLAVRYAGTADKPGFLIPGMGAENRQPVIDKRY